MSTRFQKGIACSRRCPMGCVYSGHARALISSRDIIERSMQKGLEEVVPNQMARLNVV